MPYFERHRRRLQFPDKEQWPGKQVARVGGTELPARERKQRAPEPACQQAHTAAGVPVEVTGVCLRDLPLVRPVQPESLAGITATSAVAA